MVTFVELRKHTITKCGQILVSRTYDDPSFFPPPPRVSIQDASVYIQHVPVYAGTTRTCSNTCARGAGTHGDVLNVHTEAFWMDTRGFSACTPPQQQQVFSLDSIPPRLWSRSLTFQFLMVARISNIMVSHRFLKKLLWKRFKGFLALFTGGKKCEDWSAPGVGTGCGLYFIHVVGSAGGFLHGRSWCVDAVSRWLVETSGLVSRSLAAWVMAGTGPSSCVSLRTLLKEFPVLCARAVRTWNLGHYFRCPCFWQSLFRAPGCC